MPKRNRISKYDVIYGLQVGQYYDVPFAGHSGSIAPRTGDRHTDYAARAAQVGVIVPTTKSNLESVLIRHTRETGNKYQVTQERVERPVVDPDTGIRIVRIFDVLRVTRMPDNWTPTRKRNGQHPETQRQRAYRAERDLLLSTSWDVVDDADLPGKRPVLKDAEHPDHEATLAWLAEFKQAHAPELEAVRIAHVIAQGVVAEACETLLSERTKTFKGKREVTLPHENVRRVHPNRDRAKQILQEKVDSMYKGQNIAIMERMRAVAGKNWTVLAAVDTQAINEDEIRQQMLLDKQQRELTRVLDGGPPRNRMNKDVPYNYLWWDDFVLVNPKIHPIEPGEQALVCFVRRDVRAATTEPRIDDMRKQITRANQRWQEYVEANPDCGIEAPQYGIVGRYMQSGYTILVLERLSRDSETGAYSDNVIRWDLSRPESLPVRPGTYRSLACGRPSATGWEPARSSAEVHDAVMTLRHRYNIYCSFVPQSMHGAGVYMIGRIASKDGEEVDLNNIVDNTPDNGNLSDIMGE